MPPTIPPNVSAPVALSNKPPVSLPPRSPAPSPSRPAAGPARAYQIEEWSDAGEGKAIILYGASGIGKTTLASMAPNPIFLGADDGGRMIVNPQTGNRLRGMRINSFLELKEVIAKPELFPEGSTMVVDSITAVQKLAELYTFQTVKVDNRYPTSMEEYGYGKGYRYLCETMRLLIPLFDAHKRRGVNILLLAQDANHRVANLEGTDYLKAGPELDTHGSPNVAGEFAQWVDHIFRITYTSLNVRVANPKADKGKVSGDAEHVIHAQGDLHFIAKNRGNGTIPPLISFSKPEDASLWSYVFPQR